MLADFACGRLAPPMHALVASHLWMKPDSAAFVADLEAIHAQACCSETPVSPRQDHAARLAAIFETPPLPHEAPPAEGVLPLPLRAYLGRDVDALRWRRLLPGLKEFTVESRDGLDARLYLISPGRKMPSHTHEGVETTLVLQGSFEDAFGRYGRGDVVIADGEIDHSPRAGQGGDCLCFAVCDAPLRLTGPIGRIVQKLWH